MPCVCVLLFTYTLLLEIKLKHKYKGKRKGSMNLHYLSGVIKSQKLLNLPRSTGQRYRLVVTLCLRDKGQTL